MCKFRESERNWWLKKCREISGMGLWKAIRKNAKNGLSSKVKIPEVEI